MICIDPQGNANAVNKRGEGGGERLWCEQESINVSTMKMCRFTHRKMTFGRRNNQMSSRESLRVMRVSLNFLESGSEV